MLIMLIPTVAFCLNMEKGGERPIPFYLYVDETDEIYKKAIEAGAESLMAPADMFYGDRNAGVRDRWGNRWWIATRIEDLTDEEIAERQKKIKG